jgi:septal ring factor EnvC (AmiA/AmiB activator)
MSDVDMSDEAATSVDPDSQERQYLMDTIAQLEHRLQKAQASINSYQNERGKLIDKILDLRIRLQNVVDLLEE